MKGESTLSRGWAVLVLTLCGCAADVGSASLDGESVALVAEMMTEAPSTASVTECAERESAACFGAGGPCAAAFTPWSDCVRAASCVSPDGLLDEPCVLDQCPAQSDVLARCAVDDCPAYLACFDEEAPPTEPTEPSPAPQPGCQAELEACVLGPCSVEYGSFVDCATTASCLDQDGFYDETCGDAACGTNITTLSACIDTRCAEILGSCNAPEPPPEPAPNLDCDQEIRACIDDPGAPCASQYDLFLGCASAESCFDETGLYDNACGEARCAAQIGALQACLPACALSPECGG